MRTTRIHTTQRLGPGAVVLLEPEPSRHLARALRLGVGDTLTLFDGRGGEYPAEITAVDKKQVQVVTGEHVQCERESPLDIHLGIAVSRGDRMDWVVQKATELGVTALTPLLTEHTGVKLSGERAGKKIQHWQQIAISACEQCGRNRPPVVHALQAQSQWLASTSAEQKFVLHHRATAHAHAGLAPTSIALLVGPEGGLSEAEISAAEQAGFAALRLGPRVLRTETAPLAAIAILQSHWGDMPPVK
ncbi:MAG: 16S rRNA (uracil(1498)-N(3))-methyltransferase [Halioglobus sp.]|nr:16S rRNA (uracil(1498)-N(3))-methyltransferase [Halioglobus sp.]